MPEKPKNENDELPISGSYARFARRAVPEEMRAELRLANGTTYAEVLAMALFNAAIEGSVPAAREIRESIEGKANQRPNPVARNFEVVVTYEPPLSPMLPKGTADLVND
jgi:hypothetical protein